MLWTFAYPGGLIVRADYEALKQEFLDRLAKARAAGPVDGVLLGAGDAAFLRTSTLLAAVGGFLPLIWASLWFGWGLAGIWAGLALFMLARLVAVLARLRSGRWAVTGAVRA